MISVNPTRAGEPRWAAMAVGGGGAAKKLLTITGGWMSDGYIEKDGLLRDVLPISDGRAGELRSQQFGNGPNPTGLRSVIPTNTMASLGKRLSIPFLSSGHVAIMEVRAPGFFAQNLGVGVGWPFSIRANTSIVATAANWPIAASGNRH